ncbi:MAG TPA: YlxR family protein [Anaerolineae bacterium]|nr:YlxR family protein [Anaerolineae bacterium]
MAKRRARRQPQRTCVGCRHVMPKRELTRIVRKPDGEVAIDSTGKVSGRGAYLCSNRKCWIEALKHRSLERALNVALTAQQHQAIEAYASQLPDVNSEGA